MTTTGRSTRRGTSSIVTADIVVLGLGAAGLAAALAGTDLGASVVVLEKQTADRHTPSTRMSGGLVMGVNDVAAAARYLHRCADGAVPFDVNNAWATRAAQLYEWLTAKGIHVNRVGDAEHPEFDGAESIDVYQPGDAHFRLDPAGGGGRELYDGLRRALDPTDAEIVWGARATRLLVDDDRRVIGVSLMTASGEQVVHARRAVVLCTGGFGSDEVLKSNHLPVYPAYFYGNPDNCGDGVRMAQLVGADLWHMNQFVGRAIGNFATGEGHNLSFLLSIDPPGYVITDVQGRRFADESPQARLLHGFYRHMLHYDYETSSNPRVPSYWFFDERRRSAGPLTLVRVGSVAVGLYDWSHDNSAEIECGWIARGDTVEGVAARAGLSDPSEAARSIAEYNAACEGHESDPFGRPPETMVPIDQPPFYCVELWPGGSHTTGGPRRNSAAQVLDPFGSVIAGLYAAGELGQATGPIYPSDGSSLSEALCFGQIAAEHAMSSTESR